MYYKSVAKQRVVITYFPTNRIAQTTSLVYSIFPHCWLFLTKNENAKDGVSKIVDSNKNGKRETFVAMKQQQQ